MEGSLSGARDLELDAALLLSHTRNALARPNQCTRAQSARRRTGRTERRRVDGSSGGTGLRRDATAGAGLLGGLEGEPNDAGEGQVCGGRVCNEASTRATDRRLCAHCASDSNSFRLKDDP